MENVAGMLSKTHKSDFDDFVRKLKKMNYVLSYKILNASDYLAAQDRKRVILVGFMIV